MKKIILGLCLTPFLFAVESCTKTVDPVYDVRDEYTGDFQVSDACDASNSTYNLSIFKDDYSNSDIIFGFPGLYEAGMDVHAIVTGMKIIIPIQDFYVSDIPKIFYEFSGSGSLEDSVLTVDYKVLTVQDGLIIDETDCTATMIK